MILYKLFNISVIKHLKRNSFENMLSKGISMLEQEVRFEIEKYILSQQSKNGGFKDKAGNSDIYYSLFGYFLSKTMNLSNSISALKEYIEKQDASKLKGVNLLAYTILHKQLIDCKKKLNTIRIKIRNEIATGNNQEYKKFLLLITSYYLKDIKLFKNIYKENKHYELHQPTSVLSANLVLEYISKQPIENIHQELMKRFLNGAFKANQIVPITDLLSTSVALYALNFSKADFRKLKTESFDYISSLYENGGFVATEIDSTPDIEYTFYAILGLGALN